MKTLWITGAGGFVGRHLAHSRVLAGQRVGAVGHGVEHSVADHRIEADIAVPALDRLADLTGRPDVVYHLAGGSSVGASLDDPLRDRARTVGSTVALVDWLTQNAPSVRLVAASSAAVYGDGHTGQIGTQAPLNPYSPYASHKTLMEDLCLRSGLSVSVTRLFSVYGPGLRKQLLWDICTRLAAGAEELVLGGTGQECRDWTYIEDVIRFLEKASRTCLKGGSILNAGTGEPTAVAAIAQAVVNAWSEQPVPVRFNGSRRAGDPFSLVAVPSCLPGHRWETSLSEGISRYVSWFKSKLSNP